MSSEEVVVECPHCRTQVPEVAHYCQSCGQDLQTADVERRTSFAAKPDEPVASLALISSIMPKGSGEGPQTYRIALIIGLVAALASAIFGALPIAVMISAFAIPIVYIIYLYDVNMWEDEPVVVTLLAFALTFGLALGFTLIWRMLRSDQLVGGLNQQPAPELSTFLLMALLVPIAGEIIRQLGPVLLSSRPAFDDLMDGVTFGVISGVAYASAETIVTHWPLIQEGFVSVGADPFGLASLMFLEGFVKPILLGSATGLACAEFAGLGKGYDGFTGRYFRALALTIGVAAAYYGGIYLLRFLESHELSLLLSVVWGLVLLAFVILRLRTVLHVGLMEAAMEESARSGGIGDGELEFCAACEMPLLSQARFCNACGLSALVHDKPHRVHATVAASHDSPPPLDTPADDSGEEERA